MNKRMQDFYMNFAEHCSTMSRAVRLKVGCVVVKNDNIISFSWNGTPSGWDNTCEDTHLSEDGSITLVTKQEVLHAEQNAISKLARCNENSQGATMFITHSPCIQCAKLIYQSGIKQVYYKNQYRADDGIKFLEACGVGITKL